jgi:hypothetical protein
MIILDFWLSEKKDIFLRDHPTITHVQFGFNQISSFRDDLLFFICPAVMAILYFRWTKTKLFKRVKYDTFLQNNMLIPRVVSEKILKFQHKKELVVAAILNFWIKWKTCNVENHPCNISTMFGSNWACSEQKIVLNVYGWGWMLSDGNS